MLRLLNMAYMLVSSQPLERKKDVYLYLTINSLGGPSC